ncbi:hypothetical protein C0V97_09895 [Asaia sp. W19]|uniref:hypothetical protein n=1 Tax=unclassified Asaia TaxID=2685023 RepID=UPI000F8EB3BB|nr:hypothetical protein [Asaia sp. W19]RUT25759.1 hypothetical protein C0V97_09895 [Asaia sp. W19]
MAKLSAFSRNADRMREGETIEVGPLGNTFEITTRGFTPRYRDALHDLKMAAARKLNRGQKPGGLSYGPENLPPTEDDLAQGQAIADHCVIGVQGLLHDDGREVTLDEFRTMLSAGDQPMLIALAISAAARVGDDRAREHEEAVGN